VDQFQSVAISRAPLTAIVLYPGPKANPHQKSKPDAIGFIDMAPHGLDSRRAYRMMRDATTADVAWFRAELADGSIRHDVAFCLPAECRAALEAIATVRA